MIKMLLEETGPLIGLKIKGCLTHKEYQAIVPLLEKRIKKYGKIRILLDIQHFKGWHLKAAFDDLLFAFRNRQCVERVAIVCAEEADSVVTLIDQPFARGARGKCKYFIEKDLDRAWAWLKKGMIDLTLTEKKASNELPSPKKRTLRCAQDLSFLVIGDSLCAYLVAALLKHWKIKVELCLGKEDIEAPALDYLWPIGALGLKALGLYGNLQKKSQLLSALPDEACSLVPILERYGDVLEIKTKHLKILLEDFLGRGVLKKRRFKSFSPHKNELELLFDTGKSKNYDGLIFVNQVAVPLFNRTIHLKMDTGPLALSLAFNEAWTLANVLASSDHLFLTQSLERFSKQSEHRRLAFKAALKAEEKEGRVGYYAAILEQWL